MKHHIALKFLAIILCSVFLLATLASGAGIVVLAGLELYSQTPEDMYAIQRYSDFYQTAHHLAREHAVKTYSNLGEEESSQFFSDFYQYREEMDQNLWFYQLYDSDGKLLDARYDAQAAQGAVEMTYSVSISYPMVLSRNYGGEDTVPVQETQPPTVPMQTEAPQTETPDPTVDPGQYEWTQEWQYWDSNEEWHRYLIAMVDAPAYAVTLYLLPGAYEPPEDWAWQLVELGYTHRFDLFWVLGGSVLLFAALLVYLCCAAGRKPKTAEVKPAGLNRIPLDLYFGIGAVAVTALVVVAWDVLRWGVDSYDPIWLVFAAIGAAALVCCLLAVGFLFACAAQMKMPNAWWLKHTVIGFLVLQCFRFLSWIFKGIGKFFRWLGGKGPSVKENGGKVWQGLKRGAAAMCRDLAKLATALYKAVKAVLLGLAGLLGKGMSLLWQGLRRFMELLPLTWQWLLTAFGMILLLYIAFNSGRGVWLVICMFLYLGIVLYGAGCFGTLLESTKHMSQGNLDTKVEDKLLLGSFQEYASYLNALAGVATEAAKKQMKSERMKAELVTNVSHDIKTPLTSIINYVDLLQKAESQEQAQQYLEVLSRQSQRLKKLIEDLMEMSKASTGNMAVELRPVDAVEAVNQALGEFSEKLEQAKLVPVFNPPQEPVAMIADGRLTWRVLSNLLSNAVKYALPGTRLYIDLVRLDGNVLISLKNISREQLNVSSDELMERFVRGDASRNTEGSGLGLNIAKSLMDLQRGQLQLLVDGDLFKATLVFPAEK